MTGVSSMTGLWILDVGVPLAALEAVGRSEAAAPAASREAGVSRLAFIERHVCARRIGGRPDRLGAWPRQIL